MVGSSAITSRAGTKRGQRDGDALAHATESARGVGIEHALIQPNGLEVATTLASKRRRWPKCRAAKSTNERRTRRTGFKALMEPLR